MGQLRIETIRKLFVSPEQQSEEIIAQYAKAKTEKLRSVRLSDQYKSKFVEQSVNRVKLQASAGRKLLPHYSPADCARLTEGIAETNLFINKIAGKKTVTERVFAFAKLLPWLNDNEDAAVKDEVHLILRGLELSCTETKDHSVRLGIVFPLAAAVGLRFPGLPTDEQHRKLMLDYIDQHFAKELKPLGDRIKMELGAYRRGALADYISRYRLAKAEIKPPKSQNAQ